MFRNYIIKPPSNIFNYNYSNNTICTNCGVNGHSFKQCTEPVLSYGMIIFKNSNSDWLSNNNFCNNKLLPLNNLQILMIKRKDSLHFVEFVRGKYNIDNICHLKYLISNITPYERNLILTKNFIELWQYVWGTGNPRNYRNDFEQSQIKFNQLKTLSGINDLTKSLIQDIIDDVPALWNEPEWGLPKGRRNPNESDIDCAIRETIEETGINLSQLNIFESLAPFSETFIGDNGVNYCHKYYLAITNNKLPEILYDIDNYHMTREISDIKWVNIEDAINLIRPTSNEKIEIINNAIKTITEFQPFLSGRLFNTP